MSKKRNYITGILTARYQGGRKASGSARLDFDAVYDMELSDCVIEDARYTDPYIRTADEVKSLETLYLQDVSVHFEDETEPIAKIDLLRIILRDVKLTDVVYIGDKVYGTISGVIFATERLEGEPIPASGSGGLKFDWMILSWLAILLFLLWLTWCFMIGPCRRGCPDPVVPDPIIDTLIRTDTIFIRDTIHIIDTLGTGPLQITLSWYDHNDLDLVVQTPADNYISFKRNEIDGGLLDVDMNNSSPYSSTPVENIFWKDNPPKGLYKIFVCLYRRNVSSEIPSNFVVRIKNNNNSEVIQGSVKDSYDGEIRSFDPSQLIGKDYAVLVHQLNIY